MPQHPSWSKTFIRQWNALPPRALRTEGDALKSGIELLTSIAPPKPSTLTLAEHPFDTHLLSASRLYRTSRQLFLKQGGRFIATLVSTPRTLSSTSLLKNEIEYSPIARELIWAATDPVEKKNIEHLLHLRSYTTSLFHEQSHRILWKVLPPAPRKVGSALQRFLNFSESLVIATDMALGDELGPELAGFFYLTGTVYNPGSEILRKEKPTRRAHRNFLHALAYATYLHLELYEPQDVQTLIEALFPQLSKGLARRVCERAGKIDRAFVTQTNLIWQERHEHEVVRALSGPDALELPKLPQDNRLHYLIAEGWFEKMGL